MLPRPPGPDGKCTPAAAISARNARPSASSATVPRYATRAPNPAATAHVFATDPPLLVFGAGQAWVYASACSAEINDIAPLRISCRDKNSSGTAATTSTMALPMPSRSYWAVMRAPEKDTLRLTPAPAAGNREHSFKRPAP